MIGNSIKFTYNGSIKLIISYDNTENNIVKIMIEDTGIGMNS